MVLVDTSVWIDYCNGVRTGQSDRLDELLQGFARDADYRRARGVTIRKTIDVAIGTLRSLV